ncbi:MAG: GntR family transcriptional regulator, partial [Rhizobiales bacterium 32-66-8]
MSQIVGTLALKIARLIRSEDLAEGEPLPERSLAERLLVSRSPVRTALRELEAAGIVRPLARGGHCVADPAAARALADAPPEAHGDDDAYIAIARDRLDGRIPDRISENELLRRTGITRPRLQALLRRMSEEGWVERLPGNGWRFLPVLTSMQTYRQSYTFRQAIEPAALRDPGFTLNRAGLERHLDEQRRLVAGEVLTITPVRLFQQNSALHEAICDCSGNAFF